MDVGDLVGCQVVEFGVRQAWPYVGLGDGRGSAARETRLYLDAAWAVGPRHGTPTDTGPWLLAVDECVNSTTVVRAEVTGEGDLRLGLDNGVRVVVSGEALRTTVGEPWWFSAWSVTQPRSHRSVGD